jgi:ribonuclease P protein component
LHDAANRSASASSWSEQSGRPAAGAAAASRRAADFPRACRLLRRSEFDAVYQQGRRRSSKHFVIFVHANGRPLSRFGTSVKRELGGAVVRNRIRRRVREIVRLHRQEIAPGWDMVIHPRSTVARADFSELTEELLSLIRSALRA